MQQNWKKVLVLLFSCTTTTTSSRLLVHLNYYYQPLLFINNVVDDNGIIIHLDESLYLGLPANPRNGLPIDAFGLYVVPDKVCYSSSMLGRRRIVIHSVEVGWLLAVDCRVGRKKRRE
jgi:hypothetical protein